MKNILAIILLAAAFLASCEKEETTSSSDDKKDVPVVESFLIAGADSIKVKIATLMPYTNDTTDTVEPLSGLNVMVNGYLLEEQEDGLYAYKLQGSIIPASDTFKLSFDFNQKTISAQTLVPAMPVDFAISTDTIKIKQMTASTKPSDFSSATTLELTWENSAKDYYCLAIDWMSTDDTVYTNTTMTDDISTSEVTSVTQDDVYDINQMNIRIYGQYRVILYKMNEEYYNLLNTTNKNSNSMTNPPTNVTNGWGIFTAMSTDTLYFWAIKK